MRRYSFLLIAHNEFDVLKRLVASLDDSRNDIYIHFDKKVSSLPELSVKSSRLFILNDRVDVRWGDESQLRCEYRLFEEAFNNGPYERYILLSGTHLPLVPQNVIHDYFNSLSGQEVMRIWPEDPRDIRNKLQTWHLWMRWYNSKKVYLRKIVQFLWRANLKVQLTLGVDRHRDCSFVKADNWVALTQVAIGFLVENKKRILKKYRLSFCADEYFVPSELSAHPEMFSLYNSQCLLHVVFDGANPRILTSADYEDIRSSGCLFARKFSSDNIDLLNKIAEKYA